MSKITMVSSLIAAAAAAAFSATITLQQGANGYRGCTDTYIESKSVPSPATEYYMGADANHGNKEVIGAEADYYANW